MKEETALAQLTAAGVRFPAVTRGRENWVVWSGPKSLGLGATLREAMTAAGHPPPPVTVYGSHGRSVLLGQEPVAQARTAAMADKIAKALNAYGSRR